MMEGKDPDPGESKWSGNFVVGIRLVDIQPLLCFSIFVSSTMLPFGLMAALLRSVDMERRPRWAGGGAEGSVGLGHGWAE